jgi:hypothetical protein
MLNLHQYREIYFILNFARNSNALGKDFLLPDFLKVKQKLSSPTFIHSLNVGKRTKKDIDWTSRKT